MTRFLKHFIRAKECIYMYVYIYVYIYIYIYKITAIEDNFIKFHKLYFMRVYYFEVVCSQTLQVQWFPS